MEEMMIYSEAQGGVHLGAEGRIADLALFWGINLAKDTHRNMRFRDSAFRLSDVDVCEGLKQILSEMKIFVLFGDFSLHPGAAWEWYEWKENVAAQKKVVKSSILWNKYREAVDVVDACWEAANGLFPEDSKKRDEKYFEQIKTSVLGVDQSKRNVERITEALNQISPYLLAANDKSKLENRRIHAVYGVLLLERDLHLSLIQGVEARMWNPRPLDGSPPLRSRLSS